MKLAYLTPTRERTLKRKRFQDSVYQNADYPENVVFYYYIDNDDPLLDEYLKQEIEGNRVDNVGEPMSVSKSWNVIAQRAIDEGADVIMMGNDDLTQETKGWDTILRQKIEEQPDPMYCFWFEDSINGANHNAFPIVSKEWYNLLGYFTPGCFYFGYNDTWVYEVAKLAGKSIFIPEVTTHHQHFANAKNFTEKTERWDETYNRNRCVGAPNAGAYGKDNIIFHTAENVLRRKQDAEKIIKWLKNYGEHTST